MSAVAKQVSAMSVVVFFVARLLNGNTVIRFIRYEAKLRIISTGV